LIKKADEKEAENKSATVVAKVIFVFFFLLVDRRKLTMKNIVGRETDGCGYAGKDGR
jgi:hypothetical protein